MTNSAIELGRRLPLPLAFLLIAACQVGVDQDIEIAAGETRGAAAVVNGRIKVGPEARVTGDLSTVNGVVNIDRGATVADISTVNGAISLGVDAVAEDIEGVNADLSLQDRARVEGSIELINGAIELGPQSAVGNDVAIISGAIRLRDARVGGDISTVSADVTLSGASIVAGDLRVEKPGRDQEKLPRIILGPGSRVEGMLDFRGNAEAYVSEEAVFGGVAGVLEPADLVRFYGAKPEIP